MTRMQSIARRLGRGGQDFQMVTEADLQTWARSHNLNLRQAHEAALQAGIFPECYERNFPSLSAADQWRLFRSRVLIAGAGGLGGCQAVLLARIGVGRLLVADGDIFQPANLNRQLLATHSTLGQNKAHITARHIQDLNPALIVEAIPDFLDLNNLAVYLGQVQVVLDALDTVAARRQLFAAGRAAGLPLIHGAVAGAFGQVTTIMPDDRFRFDSLYQSDETAVTGEALAPVVALIASLQVQEAIRILSGRSPAYQGRLAHFDGDTGLLEIVPLGQK